MEFKNWKSVSVYYSNWWKISICICCVIYLSELLNLRLKISESVNVRINLSESVQGESIQSYVGFNKYKLHEAMGLKHVWKICVNIVLRNKRVLLRVLSSEVNCVGCGWRLFEGDFIVLLKLKWNFCIFWYE